MANLTTTACATSLWVVLKTGEKMQLTGIASISQQDLDYFDGSTYSQIIGADVLGNAHEFVTVQETDENDANLNAGAVAASAPVLGDLNGGGTAAQTFSVSGIVGVQPAVVPWGKQSYAPVVNTDSSFVLTTTPGKTVKTRSWFIFWSQAAAAGNIVAMIPTSLVVMIGPGTPSILT